MPTLTILRALPGAGKSTLTAPLVTAGAAHASADLFPGLYPGVDSAGRPSIDVTQFDPAHAQSLRTAIEAIQSGRDCVVDNTNLSEAEVLPYVAIAQAFRADCEIVNLVVDPQTAFERNAHGVPFAVIRNSESGEIRKTYAFGETAGEGESVVGGFATMIATFAAFEAPFHWQFLPWLSTREVQA